MSALSTDTIAAIATPPGRSALAVIRLSGISAFEICDKILRQPRLTRTYAGHTLHRAAIVDSTDTIDDALVAVFHAPRSFSGENTVEITCHGGKVVVQKTLALLLAVGARHADPGEFTLRAYLNGKLDLAQAEAVIDTIDAKTHTALKLAKSQQRGDLSSAVAKLRDSLMSILVRVEATIDFPEDVGEFPSEWAISETVRLSDELRALIKSADRGVKYREGISVVLAGAPNAGKSSLLNALLRSERAIVTAVPGTTRDVIEESIDIAGIPVRLTDTAGLRETSDEVERIGVARTHAALADADIVVEVRDASLVNNSTQMLDVSETLPRIVVYNKCDLISESKCVDKSQAIFVSARTGVGLDILEAKIAEIALGDEVSPAEDSVIISHTRHKVALELANDALSDAQRLLEDSQPLDIVSIELTSALSAIGQITGETAPGEIVNEIFHRFCIGK